MPYADTRKSESKFFSKHLLADHKFVNWINHSGSLRARENDCGEGKNMVEWDILRYWSFGCYALCEMWMFYTNKFFMVMNRKQKTNKKRHVKKWNDNNLSWRAYFYNLRYKYIIYSVWVSAWDSIIILPSNDIIYEHRTPYKWSKSTIANRSRSSANPSNIQRVFMCECIRA